MRVVVTGGAGFIGRAIVRTLADRGDVVVALVRDPERAARLKRDNVLVVVGDLSSVPQLTAQMKGADAVIHAAGMYEVGIKKSQRARMYEANVGATRRVLDAASAAAVPRTVHVSTVGVFGDTHGEVVDETYRRNLAQGFVSYYDETKYLAHKLVEERIAAGAPIVIVQPSQVYGPNDHTATSAQVEAAYRGKLRYTALTSLGLAWVHVDDLAAAIVTALDRGRVGESYVLGGECVRLRDVIAIAAHLGDHKAPRLTVPTGMLKIVALINDLLGGLPGVSANLHEVISGADGVTYWARHDKATAELGFHPRTLEQGIVDAWGNGSTDAER